MFGQNRDELRRFFISAWEKAGKDQPLEPLESLVVQVIRLHPEYHAALDPEQIDRDFIPEQGETNPWLHMGMHISIGEQIGADRPPGIRAEYQRVAAAHGDAHAAEHAIMECLGFVLWEAQRNGRAPDDQAYLDCLRKIAPPAR